MPHDELVKSIITAHYARNDPLGWFDELYTTASGVADMIPWADEKPNPHLLAWLERERISGQSRTAVVVGCGLGDDAEALAARGFATTAFDLSAAAIGWATRRFPHSSVKYAAANLLEIPKDWQGTFDFVFEAYTIQALPQSLRDQAIAAVASLVKPQGGQLLIICRGRENTEETGSLPWPLSHDQIASFEKLGLRKITFENFFDDLRGGPPIRRFRALYQKG